VLSLNDRFLGAWRIDRAIADGTLLVFVELPDDQLTGLVANLKHTSTTIAFAAPAEKRN
jgi:hypothetical protein